MTPSRRQRAGGPKRRQGRGRRRICVLTSTRADYGLLYRLIQEIQSDPDLELQLAVTGSHLSPEFGMTCRAIEADGIPIARKVEMLLSSDTGVGIAKSMGLALIGFGEAFSDLRPDLAVVLGDRFEIFAAAAAATVARIPLAHIHGGEATEGLIDEAFRHGLTKMSHLHFTSTEAYRRRVIQMGEDPARVFNVGAVGIDTIRSLRLLPRKALEARLGLKLRRRNFLVTFHPVTLESGTAASQFRALLKVLGEQEDAGIVFTMPNADTDGRALFPLVKAFVAESPERRAVFTSMGGLLYLSTMAQVDAVVGNSSSGILEAPSIPVATLDIGDRQRGRIRAASVIGCRPTVADLRRGFREALSPRFREAVRKVVSPYGAGGASKRIKDALKSVDLDGILKKRFHDLPAGAQPGPGKDAAP